MNGLRNWDRDRTQIVSGLIGLDGVWLIIAPYALAFDHLPRATWNNIAVGILIIGFALARNARPPEAVWASWWNMVLGFWLIISPFVLNYYFRPAAFWNDIGMGILILVLACASAALAPAFAPRARRPLNDYRSHRPPDRF
jgi:hypothetical protein